MKSGEKAALFFATGGGLGNLPVAPGTFGSVLGLVLAYPISIIDIGFGGLAILCFSLLAVWASGQAEKILNRQDPGCIVIDEMAGMMLAVWGLPFGPATFLIGFLLFRIVDIVKPFPVGRIDNRVSGGIGIVLDDLMAGLYVNLTLRFGIKLLDSKIITG